MKNSGQGFSVAALVLGIVATVLAWVYMINIAALACGIIGIVCAAIGRKKLAESNLATGMGTAGLVMSIIGTSLAAVGFLSCTVCVLCAANSVNSAVSTMRYY